MRYAPLCCALLLSITLPAKADPASDVQIEASFRDGFKQACDQTSLQVTEQDGLLFCGKPNQIPGSINATLGIGVATGLSVPSLGLSQGEPVVGTSSATAAPNLAGSSAITDLLTRKILVRPPTGTDLQQMLQDGRIFLAP